MSKRLEGHGLAELARLIEGDPRSFAQEVLPGRPGLVRVPCVGQPIALLQEGWRNFFADQDFEVLLGVPVCSSPNTVNIQYADLECFYARPQRSFRKWTFLDWPEESDDPGGGGDAGSRIVAELGERDMILGTGERADALVSEVRERAAAGDYLLFSHLCTPIVMGEDLQGLSRRCEREVGGKGVRWSQKDRDTRDNFGEHLRALLSRPGFFDVPSDPSAVNLFHFPRPFRDAELKPFLEAVGLAANICVFPDVDLADLEGLPKARYQVFCERSSYPTRMRDLLCRSPRPVATVPAPYGLAGTRECLRGIAALAGRADRFERAWGEKAQAFMDPWEAMKREAASYRLAFVVSEETLPLLRELRYGQGAPMGAMVVEMGFGIDLLYYDIHGDAPCLLPGLEGAGVAVFRTPWELERALLEGRFHAVFSDIVFDRRINRAGKARFSSRDFEMGLEGARRSFERLLDVCRLPFFRRYARQLSDPDLES